MYPVPAAREDYIEADGGAGRVIVPSGIAGHEHIGSAHDDAELDVLKAVARQCVAAS